jgi:hypothetical protein
VTLRDRSPRSVPEPRSQQHCPPGKPGVPRSEQQVVSAPTYKTTVKRLPRKLTQPYTMRRATSLRRMRAEAATVHVYISADMEGVTGLVDADDVPPGGRDCKRGQEDEPRTSTSPCAARSMRGPPESWSTTRTVPCGTCSLTNCTSGTGGPGRQAAVSRVSRTTRGCIWTAHMAAVLGRTIVGAGAGLQRERGPRLARLSRSDGRALQELRSGRRTRQSLL